MKSAFYILLITAATALDMGKGRALQRGWEDDGGGSWGRDEDEWVTDDVQEDNMGMGQEFENTEEVGFDSLDNFNVDDEDNMWDSSDAEESSSISTLAIVGITAAACAVLIGVLMVVNKRKSSGRGKWDASSGLATSPQGSGFTL